MSWLADAGIVVILVFIVDLLVREMLTTGGSIAKLVFFPLLFSAIAAVLFYGIEGNYQQFIITGREGLLLLLIGVINFAVFFFVRRSQESAPNIGYTNALMQLATVGTVIYTGWQYGDHFTVQSIFGISAMIGGAALLVKSLH